jgi:uncharacterized membrane protein
VEDPTPSARRDRQTEAQRGIAGRIAVNGEAPSASAPASEPRWPAFLALLATGGLYAALPASLSVGPRWLPLLLVGVLLLPAAIAHHYRRTALTVPLGRLVSAVVTFWLIWSLALLVRALIAHREPAPLMLRSAAALWVTNVLVFASWYWRLDSGGPHMREQREGHVGAAFLFPQWTLNDPVSQAWSPMFQDYLFLAFSMSMALSPADTAVLSRWAKGLVMIQAMISLTVVVVVAARAVNVL